MNLNILHILSICLLSSRLMSKNVKTKMCRIVAVPFVLCRCETWSVTLTFNLLSVFSECLLFMQPRSSAYGSLIS